MSSHWLALFAAIAVELAATIGLKSAGASLFATLASLALIALSFTLVSLALKAIPVALAYAVWEGFGLVGIAVIGHVLFGEVMTPQRLAAFALIMAGIVLLERGSAAGEERPAADPVEEAVS